MCYAVLGGLEKTGEVVRRIFAEGGTSFEEEGKKREECSFGI